MSPRHAAALALVGWYLIVRAYAPPDETRSACVPSSAIPSSVSTTILPAFRTVDSRCAMTSVVRLRASRFRDSWTDRSLSLSSALVASSKIRDRVGSNGTARPFRRPNNRAPFCHGSYGLRSRGIWWDLPGSEKGFYKIARRGADQA